MKSRIGAKIRKLSLDDTRGGTERVDLEVIDTWGPFSDAYDAGADTGRDGDFCAFLAVDRMGGFRVVFAYPTHWAQRSMSVNREGISQPFAEA